MTDKSKLSTESYKGVRDFYPEDFFYQNHIFNIWRDVVESFGYSEYNASVLEPAELYRAKSGEEIANEQTYTFTDRGGRDVTLRPEMTPTVARLVAARAQELVFPLRWYSIPNLFRYEKPQRGRLREHWQLNVDIFGIDSLDADLEILSISSEIMKKLGANETDFEIKLNSRKIMNQLYEKFGMDESSSHKASKLIDKKAKISHEAFETSLTEILGDKATEFISLISAPEKLLEYIGEDTEEVKALVELLEKIEALGINNVVFDPTLMRGFDYYTGMVFEVFDTHPDNNRSVFGGGRYDDLLDIFGAKKVAAVGFGAGDVTVMDFLLTHGLMPKYKNNIDIYLCPLSSEFMNAATTLAQNLRKEGLNVAIDISGKKVGDQMKSANKQGIPFVICIGENEVKDGLYPLKNMETGDEIKLKPGEIAKQIKK